MRTQPSPADEADDQRLSNIFNIQTDPLCVPLPLQMPLVPQKVVHTGKG